MWTEEKGTAKFVLFPNELRGLFTVQLAIGNDRVVIEMNPKDMATFLNGEPIECTVRETMVSPSRIIEKRKKKVRDG